MADEPRRDPRLNKKMAKRLLVKRLGVERNSVRFARIPGPRWQITATLGRRELCLRGGPRITDAMLDSEQIQHFMTGGHGR